MGSPRRSRSRWLRSSRGCASARNGNGGSSPPTSPPARSSRIPTLPPGGSRRSVCGPGSSSRRRGSLNRAMPTLRGSWSSASRLGARRRVFSQRGAARGRARGARGERLDHGAPDELGVFQEVLCVDVRAGKVVSLPEENARRPMAAGKVGEWTSPRMARGARRSARSTSSRTTSRAPGRSSRSITARDSSCRRSRRRPVGASRLLGKGNASATTAPLESQRSSSRNGSRGGCGARSSSSRGDSQQWRGALLSIELRVPLGATLRLRSMTLTAR